METKKGFCSSCPYWKHKPEQAQPATLDKRELLAGAVRTIEVGDCFYARPKLMQVAMPGTLHGQMQAQMVRIYPQMTEHEFCADHPDRFIERAYVAERARVRARAETVEYDPAKYTDTGFNSPPSLEAAKKISMVADGSKVSGGDA